MRSIACRLRRSNTLSGSCSLRPRTFSPTATRRPRGLSLRGQPPPALAVQLGIGLVVDWVAVRLKQRGYAVSIVDQLGGFGVRVDAIKATSSAGRLSRRPAWGPRRRPANRTGIVSYDRVRIRADGLGFSPAPLSDRRAALTVERSPYRRFSRGRGRDTQTFRLRTFGIVRMPGVLIVSGPGVQIARSLECQPSELPTVPVPKMLDTWNANH